MRIIELSAVAALIALPGVLFLACSSNNELAPPVVVDAGPAPTVDADMADGDGGVDAEQPPDIYPAQHQPIPQMDFLGGPILDHMKIITVTFAKTAGDGGVGDAGVADGGEAGAPACTPPPLGDPACPALRTFDDFIVKSDWWHQTMAGYKVFDGTSGGYRELDDTVSGKAITNEDIAQMIVDAVGNGRLPAPDAQTLYALYFPASTNISLGSALSCQNGGFYAYHNAVTIGAVGAAYAVMARCQAADVVKTRDLLTVSASHEFAEAASDPLELSTPAYYMATNDAWSSLEGYSAGGENGDVCAAASDYNESGYKVQPIWSNQAAMESRDPCEPTPDGVIYYGAAVRTELQTITKGHKSDGYLLINKGESLDAKIDVFSQKALPHDLKIFVGRSPNPFAANPDPTDLPEIQNGITAKLSRNVVHNGNAVVMTVSVPATAVKGDFKFVVRSVLEQNDFHDWPVIVHVN